MSHGVKYFVWRNGRPRWSPGPKLRDLGWKGRDLKTPDGQWMPLEQALAAARATNLEVEAAPRQPPADYLFPHRQRVSSTRNRPRSVVYFLFVGNMVKIGQTIEVSARIAALQTGLTDDPVGLVVVPGTRDDEQAAHRFLRASRWRREWFHADHNVRAFVARCIMEMRVSIPDATERKEQK